MANCIYCKKPYETKEEARECYKEHEVMYVPMSASDLNKLNMFLFSKDTDLLTESLVETIRLYAHRASERQLVK